MSSTFNDNFTSTQQQQQLLDEHTINDTSCPVSTSEPTKSITLAERRRIPESTEKFKLYQQSSSSTDQPFDHIILLSPTKISEDALLSHLERQQKAIQQLDSSVSETISLSSTPVIQIHHEQQQQQDEHHMAFWKLLIQDYITTAQRYPSLLLTLLCENNGIPHSIRGAVWQAMATSNSSHLMTVYEDLAQHSLSSSSSSSPFMSLIEHDVDTLYGHKYPQHILDIMKKILKVYTLYDPQLDYSTACLSLLFPLLRYVSESQAFCLFVRLMGLYDMRSMFVQKKVNAISVKSRLFELLLGQFYPQLASHLDQHLVQSIHYAGPWYTNILSNVLPDEAFDRMYDLVFALGAMETITRAGMTLMQQAQSQLLAMDDSKSLLLSVCTSKLFDIGYHGDVNAFILDTMACGTTVSQHKLVTMMDTLTSQMEMENEITKKREQASIISVTQSDLENKKKEKRESWFSSWPSISNRQQEQQDQQEQKQEPLPVTPVSPSSTSFSQQNDRTVPLLHQQIEDLVTALSQLQKDHTQQSEELMTIKLRDMESQVERSKLQKRNSTLEKKVKKYKTKLTQQQQQLSMNEHSSVLNQQDEQYRSFVQSLRLSGNFGALVAGALDNESTKTTRPSPQQQKRQSIHSQTQTENQEIIPSKEEVRTNNDTSTDAMHAVTSELVAVKLANFEMGQKYERLCHKYNDMDQSLTQAKQQIKVQTEQLEQMTQQLEQSTRERDEFLEEQATLWSEEQETLLQENEDWMDKVMAARKTASELHMDKLALLKKVERLEQRVEQLETEKREYLMPRNSFAEDVFATHNLFFGEKQKQDETVLSQEQQQALDEFRLKYVETDLRCRELEKLLAEAKVKIAEYETSSGRSSIASSFCCSPRASLQQRASSLQMKRASTASFLTTTSSIFAGGYQPTTQSGTTSRVATPTSPTTNATSPSTSRLSNESCASSATSSSVPSLGSHSKRASMYARICSSFSTTPNTNMIKSPILYEEPQSSI
ncbi:rab-GTPase-TBC domain-containing protein [Halteromyces radiatus]|uniref:rab-GTPase-TBC domain-containing protein n=1 Tax=Halteromyces radiatus TaxID=101107 RepID=UPI00221FC639|nr:rab-GTPase-TBC domain-containing protein [Halteromyces radiatus]KAI8097453.1 rab-GTPase-TBC domain-containing protein [Halteromyces radiatus]